jgi:predicted AAA+ superfamily ATPase
MRLGIASKSFGQVCLSLVDDAGRHLETFIFAQLRERERRAGRMGSLFFWRDRTREVDFVVDIGGRLELFEANGPNCQPPATQ